MYKRETFFVCDVRLDRGRPRPRDFQIQRAGDEPVRWLRATYTLHGVLLFPLLAISEQRQESGTDTFIHIALKTTSKEANARDRLAFSPIHYVKFGVQYVY